MLKKVGKDPDGNVWQIVQKLSVQISDSLQGFFRAGGAGAIATRMASGAKACHSFQGDATRNRGLFFTRFALAIGFFFPILAGKVGTSFASTRCHVWGCHCTRLCLVLCLGVASRAGTGRSGDEALMVFSWV